MKTYEDVILSIIENDLQTTADELSIEYKLNYDPATDELFCAIRNSELAGDFAYKVSEYVKTSDDIGRVKFSFPNKLK